MEMREILDMVEAGRLSAEEAASLLAARERAQRSEGYEDLGFARLDTARGERTGFAEVVFCAGKPDAYLPEICYTLYEKNGEFLGTRASTHQYELVKEAFREKYGDAEAAERLCYNETSRILKLEKRDKPEGVGLIAVCTAGTADIPVAEEAAETAAYFGARCDRSYDVGVSGLHRLLSRLDRIRAANCVIAAAGMEGALASVLGGLVERPVIAVPTSVGYGVSEGGHTALRAMLSSCANGIAVVNIDNGYGAGYLATQINRLAVGL